MKNNKGMILAEETLKIVVAVIAIGFLVYLLTSIYFSAQSSKELEQAKETLPFILNEAKAGKTSVDIYNPKDWWIFSSGRDLCICKESEPTSCMQEGICQTADYAVQEPIKIENPPLTIQINQDSKTISK